MEKKEAPAVGIDLGTTYSCVAVWQNGNVEIIANDLGNRTTPSIVAFTDEKRLIGEGAMYQAAMNPVNTIFDCKHFIGRRFNEPFVQVDKTNFPFKIIEGPNNRAMVAIKYKGMEKQLAPELISSMVLTKMKETAEAYLGTMVTNVVITVPAYFNNFQRQATMDAGFIAGFEGIRITSESTAAAIGYGVDKLAGISNTKRVLVFDFGSGALDVCVAIIEEGAIKVKGVAGDTRLGGSDFDNRMVNHLVKEFKMKHKMDMNSNPKALRKLKTACEKAKRTLSTNAQTNIEIDSLIGDIDFHSTITRAKFEELNLDDFKHCIKLVEKCLSDSKMDKNEIDDIILVGGSTRIPMVQRMLQAFFNGKELCKSINPDEIVACGAAIQAASLGHASNHARQNSKLLPEVIEVTSLSVGFDAYGNKAFVLIPKNNPIPARKFVRLTTTKDKQNTMLIKLLEGEHTEVTQNNMLGEFTISGLPPAPKGALEIPICLDIDFNGRLDVHVQDIHSGQYNRIRITNSGRLSNEEIKQLALESKNFKEEDEKYQQIAIAKNALEDFLYKMSIFINDGTVKKILSLSEKKKIEEFAGEGNTWLEQQGQSAEVGQFQVMMRMLEDLLNETIRGCKSTAEANTLDQSKNLEDILNPIIRKIFGRAPVGMSN